MLKFHIGYVFNNKCGDFIARKIELIEAPSFHLNSDYEATDVPLFEGLQINRVHLINTNDGFGLEADIDCKKIFASVGMDDRGFVGSVLNKLFVQLLSIPLLA